MRNPFTRSPLDTLSNGTLGRSIAEYRKMLLQLGRFTDSPQIQGLRAQVRHAIARLGEEVERRNE
jgi:hypothetical protein